MSANHDFSDPATLDEDTAYWRDLYRRSPEQAIRELQNKIDTLCARYREAYPHLGGEVDYECIRLFWEEQKLRESSAPGERLQSAKQHLHNGFRVLCARMTRQLSRMTATT